MPGIEMSTMATSNGWARTRSSASKALAASSTLQDGSLASSMRLSPSRTTAWSSTIRIRMQDGCELEVASDMGAFEEAAGTRCDHERFERRQSVRVPGDRD
jgi:hypothetical protein